MFDFLLQKDLMTAYVVVSGLYQFHQTEDVGV